MGRLVYSPEAQDDLTRIAAHVEKMASRDIAKAIDAHLRDTCRAMADTAFTGAPRPQFGEGVCMHPLGNYLVFHRLDKDTLTIIRILHGDRDTTERFFTR